MSEEQQGSYGPTAQQGQWPAPPPPPPPGQWVYQTYGPLYPVPARPPSSGLRISAGIVSLVLTLWNLLAFVQLFTATSGPGGALMGFLLILHMLSIPAVLVMGIVILAKQRSRGGKAPKLLLVFTAMNLVAFIGIMLHDYAGFFVVTGTPWALAAVTLAALAIGRRQ